MIIQESHPILPLQPFPARRPILGGKVNFPLCLAPMVGLSHVSLRRVVRHYLPKDAFTTWPTEMLSSRRIPAEDLAKTPEAMRHPDEVGLVPQILGNEEKYISASVEKLIQWGAEGIDINMGCPVQKALKHNYGVALMGDASYAADVVRMTVKHSNVPVSVKLRAGLQGDFEYLVKFVEGLVEAGASWICLHPRTSEQKRRGVADWDQIKRLRERVSVPVIGNGDIQVADDVFEMMRETGCDMAMAGRALAARPWMMWQVGERLGFVAPPHVEALGLGVWDETMGRRRAPITSEEEGREYGKTLFLLLAYLKETLSPELAMRKFRFHIRTTSVWLLFGQTVISIVTKAKTLDEIEAGLTLFFSSPVEMCGRTQLRE